MKTCVDGIAGRRPFRLFASYTMSNSPALVRARAWPETHPGPTTREPRRFAFGHVNELVGRDGTWRRNERQALAVCASRASRRV